MDYRKTDKSNDMVKMTIKRADDSTEDKRWICKRIDDDPESKTAVETVREADESLQEEDENLNNETECADDWYQKIPSYLEIEMKEGVNQELSRRSSTENNANTSMIHYPTSSRSTIDSASTSCDDPLDLSTKHPQLEFEGDITNVPYKSPPEAHASKSNFLGNVHAEGRNAPSLTGADRIIQNKATYCHPRTVYINDNIQNIPPVAIQRQSNYGDAFVMSTIGIPSTSYNFPMNHHGVFPVNIGFVSTEKPEITMQGNIPDHLTQYEQGHLKTNSHFSNDTANFNHCISEPHSNANRSISRSLGPEGSANAIPLRNVFSEKTGDNFVNKSQNCSSNFKRPSENCVQIGSSDASESVCPPRKKQSHTEVTDNAGYCNVCDKKFRSVLSYNNHTLTKQHLKKMKQVSPQQSNLYNYQPNSEGKLSGQTNLQPQQLPPPHALQLLHNPMWYHPLQVRTMIPANQSGASKEKTNNTDVQTSRSEISKTSYNEESLGHIRPQNYFGTELYPHNPTHMNPPVSHINNPQGIFLLPNPQLEIPMMANPKYLMEKAFHSSQAPKDISVQIQPEGLTVVNSFQKFGDIHSETQHQEKLFQTFYCMVCSIFKTDFLPEMELHINVDRSRTPLELIVPSVEGLYCKLCNFLTRLSTEMAQHCTSREHVNRVKYYNHVREGGIHRTESIITDIHKPFWVFCAACEYAAESMSNLKSHTNSRKHQYNVSCCMYIESFSTAVEYYFCKPCNLKTLTKMELLLHARSNEHKKMLQKYPSDDGNFPFPEHIFYIKELNKSPKVSEQNEGSTDIGKEELHFRKQNNENESSVNSDSESSTSLHPQTVFCHLCQQVFPKLMYLNQHLQRYHGVNEAGLKWLVSAISKKELKINEEESLPEKEITDRKARKVKSITIWPDKSSAADEKLPIERTINDSFSYQSSVVTGQNEEIEFSECSRVVRQGQKVATDDNLNQESRNSNTSSSQQFNETERMRKADKLDQSPYLNPYGITCIDPSSSQEIYGTEGRRKPDLHQKGKINIDSASKQQFCKTKNILVKAEKNVPNSMESLNSNSSQDEITAENDSAPTKDRKYEREMNNSSSEQFSPTETGSLLSHSILNTSTESNDSCSIDVVSVPYERLSAKQKQISRTRRGMVIDSTVSQIDELDSQNIRSPLEHQPNLNLKRNESNCSPIRNSMTSIEPNQKAKDRMELNDLPSGEFEAQFYAENSTSAIDLQMQASKDIENIEISGVFSLRGHIDINIDEDISNNTDEDDDTSDFDMYSDL